MSSSLFVTGGSGYLGRCFLQRIPPASYDKIYCLARGPITATLPNQRIISGDLLQPEFYRDALRDCDTVVHMAALTGKARKSDYFRNNTEASAALLDAAADAGVRNLLYVSTIAVKFTGLDRYHYAASKAAAEQIVRRSGLAYTILRPTMIFGRNAPVLESLSRLAMAPLLPVFGDGRNLVQPVFVEDVVSVMLAILSRDGFANRVAEIGGPDVLTMEELLLKIRRSKAPRVLHIPVGPLLPIMDLLEKIAFPLLPFTGGQLSSFTNPGTADPSTAAGVTTVDQMLSLNDKR